MFRKIYNILVISDNKQSSLNQALGVANLIKEKSLKRVRIKKITFFHKWISFFPNLLIFYFLKFNVIKFNTDFQFQKIDLIISCGRITAPLSLIIKKKKNIKNFHIFNPYFKIRDFDKILIPYHDIKIKYPNIIRFDGSILNEQNKKISKSEQNYFKKQIFLDNKKQNICILIGGNGKSSSFSQNDINNFINYLFKINRKYYSLFFLFSRRTPPKLKKYIKQSFGKFSYIWNEKQKNPYWFLLNNCNFFIVTSDSISMTSEAISTNKPVFVFEIQKIKKKILRFQNNLITTGRTKSFKGNIFKWNFSKRKKNKDFINSILKDISL